MKFTGAWMDYLLMAIAALLFISLIWLLVKLIDNQWERKLRKMSKRYCALKEINANYPFYQIPSPYVITRKCSNKNTYDAPEYMFVLKYVENDIDEFNLLNEKAQENAEWDQLYCDELENLPPLLSKKELRKLRIIPNIGRKIEKRIVNAKYLYPVTELTILCKIKYTSPGGRNSYYREGYFDAKEIQKIFDSIEARRCRKEAAEYQRSKMSPSLRYNVMKRDGFRCTICGRSAIEDNVQLHVDHICPVSKGGKTELSNLRTLCQDCNLGKSDKYDPDGIN